MDRLAIRTKVVNDSPENLSKLYAVINDPYAFNSGSRVISHQCQSHYIDIDEDDFLGLFKYLEEYKGK